MHKKLFFTFFGVCMIFLCGCGQLMRSDPDLLYSCIDSFPTEISKSDKGVENELSDKQLEAIEFCLKRS